MRLDDGKVAALLERARREVDEGLLPSCQLALAVDGEVVVDQCFGDANVDTRYVVFSCTKGIVAGAVWLAFGDGALAPEQKVAEVIPEFATNGKDVITVEQLLLHTAGLPRAPMGPDVWGDRDKRLERYAGWRLNWDPGTRMEYHPTSAYWVLADLVQQATGQDYRRFIAERITEPLGLKGMAVGVPVDAQDGIATLLSCGAPPDPDEVERLLGIREIPLGEVTEEHLLHFNDPDVRTVGVPGGGGVARASDVALYYQALLHNPGGLWDADVLRDGTSVVRTSFPDPLIGGVPANRTRGLVVAGDDGKAAFRGFGRTVSGLAFGHMGAGGQVASADPETGLSFCYLTNGMDANLLRSGRRGTSLGSKAAACVS
ncbi:MAG: beta-lactamase family protein [Acidimicrobiia bacterium]|nr:beta-lactamase family protein [Acidimicrobiia bacterium]